MSVCQPNTAIWNARHGSDQVFSTVTFFFQLAIRLILAVTRHVDDFCVQQTPCLLEGRKSYECVVCVLRDFGMA